MASMTPEQLAALKRMTPAEKLGMASRFYWSARALKRAGLRTLNPSLSREQLDKKVKESFLYAAS